MSRKYVISTLLLTALFVGCKGTDTDSQDPPGFGGSAGTGGTAGSGASGGTGGGLDAGETGGSGGSGGSTDAGPDAGPIDPCANLEELRPSCQPLTESFPASTTLEAGCYLASKSPVIGAGVTLTLSPGVTIIFAENTGLTFSADQALVAAGTAEEPICLTGDQPERGFWRGLLLGRTDGDDDKLDYVTIEYAGSTQSDAEAAAIKAVSDSRAIRMSISNTTVRGSEGYGLFFVGSVETPSFENNTFTENALGPASVDSDVAGLLDSGSTYTGNDVDQITVRTNRITKNGTWQSLGVPFHLLGNLNVDSPWTIVAPNTLVMAQGARISVNGDDAALHAVGFEAAPILFTGETEERGFWTGILFNGTNHPDNALEHVVVQYAGSTEHDVDGAGVKAIADSHGVTLRLKNTILRENEGFGLYLPGSADLPEFSDNTLTSNGRGPARVDSEVAHLLDTATTYTGNELDHLRVHANRVSQAVTWEDLGVPYELDGNLHVDLVWTLAPGVTLLMAQDSWISVDGDESGFHAVGTAQAPITISGVEKTAGYWHSLRFGTTLNAANALEYAVVEYGGSTGGGGEEGMINATSDSHGVALSVRNSAIRNSLQCGIWLGFYAQHNDDIETSNTFENNAGDVCYEP